MTITDAQIEAAAEAAWDFIQGDTHAYFPNAKRLTWLELCQLADQSNSGSYVAKDRDYCLSLARAALEAAEAAAWSTDMEAAPQDGTEIAAETNDDLVLSVYWEDGYWTTGMHDISGLKRWAHLPTPPTEGDR